MPDKVGALNKRVDSQDMAVPMPNHPTSPSAVSTAVAIGHIRNPGHARQSEKNATAAIDSIISRPCADHATRLISRRIYVDISDTYDTNCQIKTLGFYSCVI
jgi:hypothetical protein